MSAEADLHNVCQEWQRLALTEGEAIRARNWSLLADCQSALRQLQPELQRHLQAARDEWARLGDDGVTQRERFHVAVAGLVRIESRNQALLGRLREAARERLDHLQRAGATLRQIRRSYAPPRPAAWTSFS